MTAPTPADAEAIARDIDFCLEADDVPRTTASTNQPTSQAYSHD